MANFIYLDTTVNSEAATQSDSMATAKVVDDDEALMNMSYCHHCSLPLKHQN